MQIESCLQLVTSVANNSVALLLEFLGFENISLMTWKAEEDNAFLSDIYFFSVYQA